MANKIMCLTTIAYAENITKYNIIAMFDSLGLDYAISPLHDKDKFKVGEKAGQYKKPHFHIMIQGKIGKKLKGDVQEELGNLRNQPMYEVRNTRDLYEYFTHKNENGEKELYDEKDIVTSENFNIDFTNVKAQSTLKLVYDIIEKENITDYYQMIRYFLAYPDNDVTEFVFRYDAKFRTYLFFKTKGVDDGRFFG